MKRDSLYILTSLLFGMIFSSLGFAEPTTPYKSTTVYKSTTINKSTTPYKSATVYKSATINKSATMKEPLKVILDFHNPKSVKMVDNILEHTSRNKEAHVVVEIWGPTIKYMLKNSKEEKDFEKFVKLSNGRIQFHVCENTMHKFHITKDMMGNFAEPVKGALIDMNRLEKEGYMYVKP
jgi:intracellular sulfur oxidation DsrE/DsrF family protein